MDGSGNNNLFSSILDHNLKIAKGSAAAGVGCSIVDTFKFDPKSIALHRADDKRSVLCKPNLTTTACAEECSSSSRSAPGSAAAQYAFCITDVAKREADSLLSSPHIEYCLFVVRAQDNASRLVRRRYSELHTYYSEMTTHNQIVNCEGLVFPTGGSQLLNSFESRKDPSSRYVQQRRAELEVFFNKLFLLNPYLYSHPYTCEFLELSLMPIIDHREERVGGRDEKSGRAGLETSKAQPPPLSDNLFSSIVSLSSSIGGTQDAGGKGRNLYSV